MAFSALTRAFASNWKKAQNADVFVKKRQIEQYRSRAAYKLMEIQQRYKVLRTGMVVVELGCSPGGWTQLAARYTKSTFEKPTVFAYDLDKVLEVEGAMIHQLDITDEKAGARIWQHLNGNPADVILSDLSHKHTGDRDLDCTIVCQLHHDMIMIADEILKPGGVVLSKVFMGAAEPDLYKFYTQLFSKTQRIKPEASRSRSREIYYLAKGWKKGSGMQKVSKEETEEQEKKTAMLLLQSHHIHPMERKEIEQELGVQGTSVLPELEFLSQSPNEEITSPEQLPDEFIDALAPRNTDHKPIPQSLGELMSMYGEEYKIIEERALAAGEPKNDVEIISESDYSDEEPDWIKNFELHDLIERSKEEIDEEKLYESDNEFEKFLDHFDESIANKYHHQHDAKKVKIDRNLHSFKEWVQEREDSSIWDSMVNNRSKNVDQLPNFTLFLLNDSCLSFGTQITVADLNFTS